MNDACPSPATMADNGASLRSQTHLPRLMERALDPITSSRESPSPIFQEKKLAIKQSRAEESSELGRGRQDCMASSSSASLGTSLNMYWLWYSIRYWVDLLTSMNSW